MDQRDEMAEVFKALSERWRLRILDILPRGPQVRRALSVTELVEKLGLSQPCVSHHLKVLKQAGLVDCRKDCSTVYYYVNATRLNEIRSWMAKELA